MTSSNQHQGPGVVQAWRHAGREVGAFVEKLGKTTSQKLREDDATSLNKLQTEARNAAKLLKKADSKASYIDAGKEIAQETGKFLKGVYGSVRSSVDEVKQSPHSESVKAALKSAVVTSRDRVDDVVDNVRKTRSHKSFNYQDQEVPDIIDGEIIHGDEPTEG